MFFLRVFLEYLVSATGKLYTGKKMAKGKTLSLGKRDQPVRVRVLDMASRITCIV